MKCAYAILLLMSVFSLGLATAQTAKPPLWYDNLEAAYPQATYIAFTGSGNDLATARNDGLLNLARFFGVSVEAFSEGSRLYTEQAGAASLATKLAETVKIRTQADLFAVRYSEPFQAGNLFYIVAYLNKKECALALEEVAQSLSKRLVSVLAALKSPPDVATRLARAGTARVLLAQIETVLKKLRLIDPDLSRKLGQQFPLDAAFEQWEFTQRSIRFAVQVEGDSGGRFVGRLQSLLSAEGFATDPKGQLGIKASAGFTDVIVSPPFKTVEWSFKIALADDQGRELVVSQKSGRSSGSSRDTALIQANQAFESFAADIFMAALREFLASKVWS